MQRTIDHLALLAADEPSGWSDTDGAAASLCQPPIPSVHAAAGDAPRPTTPRMPAARAAATRGGVAPSVVPTKSGGKSHLQQPSSSASAGSASATDVDETMVLLIRRQSESGAANVAASTHGQHPADGYTPTPKPDRLMGYGVGCLDIDHYEKAGGDGSSSDSDETDDDDDANGAPSDDESTASSSDAARKKKKVAVGARRTGR